MVVVVGAYWFKSNDDARRTGQRMTELYRRGTTSHQTRQDKLGVPTQFEMFSDDPAGVAEATSEPQGKRSPGLAMTEQDMVEQLTASGRYRVLRKLEPRTVATAVRPGFPLNGVILDAETTGLNHRKEQIIEIGLIAFTFDEQGTIGDITGVYGGLQQPTISIPPEITKLTGITDEMVAGQMIDMQAVRALVEPADLIIAHTLASIGHSARHSLRTSRTRPGLARTQRSIGQHVAPKAPSLAI